MIALSLPWCCCWEGCITAANIQYTPVSATTRQAREKTSEAVRACFEALTSTTPASVSQRQRITSTQQSGLTQRAATPHSFSLLRIRPSVARGWA